MNARSSRSALTLLEVMIVLTISVSLLAIAWPRVRRLTERSVLKEAALQVKSALVEARDRAIRGGTEISFRYAPREPDYWIAHSMPVESDELQGVELVGQSEWIEHASSVPTDSRRDSPVERGVNGGQLPDDIVFADHASQEGRDRIEMLLDPLSKAMEMPERSIQFFADGRGTTATIRLISPELSQSISIAVRGLTGAATIGPIERHVEQDAEQDLEETSPSLRSEVQNVQ